MFSFSPRPFIPCRPSHELRMHDTVDIVSTNSKWKGKIGIIVKEYSTSKIYAVALLFPVRRHRDGLDPRAKIRRFKATGLRLRYPDQSAHRPIERKAYWAEQQRLLNYAICSPEQDAYNNIVNAYWRDASWEEKVAYNNKHGGNLRVDMFDRAKEEMIAKFGDSALQVFDGLPSAGD